MSWEKLEPIKATISGCVTCGTLVEKAPMDMVIAVGFGDAQVTKDGETIYSELDHQDDWNKLWTFQDAENAAKKDPDHDWRVVMDGPLRGRTFQRHGDGEWVLVAENNGFV